jgi:solute carrier family 50 protein (sugar transporter)
MQISSVKTALKIVEDKSVNKLSALPFVALLTNCIVWSLYGYLKWDFTVLIPNFTGVLAGLFGTICFHKFCSTVPAKLYTISTAVVAAAALFATRRDASSIGLIGCTLAVILSGSPLATVGTIIRDKSTAALPFLNSFTTWLNALTWLLYGSLIAHDVMIYGPNFMGFVLSSIQMLLFAIYGMPPVINKEESSKDEMKPFIG